MLIVDAQIHLWEKGTPSAHHRQEPYLAEEAIADMDQAGVDRALIHPVLWDPDSNELAVAACANTPTVSRSWVGSISTTRTAATSSRTEGAAGHARPAVLYQRAAPAILVHRRHSRLAVARRRALA
jgi:predicted TIM-barrel fold metal-dependent hydrolase